MELGEIPGKLVDSRQKQLQRVCAAYRKQSPSRLITGEKTWTAALAAEEGAESASVIGPFLGDDAMGEWSWKSPLSISEEEEAIRWLPLVGRYAATDLAKADHFLQMMFRVRQRDVWVPAARGLAARARRYDRAREHRVERWVQCFPGGLPERWPVEFVPRLSKAGSRGPDPQEESRDRRHAARHMLLAVVIDMGIETD